jgi:succinoglycan biosynthesis protein ExoA
MRTVRTSDASTLHALRDGMLHPARLSGATVPDPLLPSLSVVMPVRDDAAYLPHAVAAVLTQDYPTDFEVVLAVGPSADGTEQVAEELARTHPRVHTVPNPRGATPSGLNAAIAVSRGEVVARVDSHSEPGPGYLRRAVEVLVETGADNVGGVQRAVGDSPLQQAVAAAMSSRFGVGDAKFHYGGTPGPTDTVYLGVFRRTALERVGGFDESLVRNQDYELNWRLRDTGGVVYFHPDLSVVYRPRDTWRGLARQYAEYGWWKAVVLRRHPRSVRLRQLAPPVALVANVLGLAVGTVWRPAAAAPIVYLTAATAAAATTDAPWRARVRLPLVFTVMHHAWGAGLLASGLRNPPSLDSGAGAPPPARRPTA